VTTSRSTIESSRQQLLGELQGVTRQVERRLRLQAILVWLVATLSVIAGLLFVDCLFQREEIGLRWLSWIILISSSAYAANRWLKPLLQLRIRPLDIAQWIERKQPVWSGRISTALELAEIDEADNRYGSQSFRDAALANWSSLPDRPKWDELISNRRLKQAATILMIVAGLIAIQVTAWPELGMHALKRLFVPWSNEPWPRADQLQFVNLPAAVGPESVIQLEVKDLRPPMPQDVVIELKYAQSEEAIVSIPTQSVSDLAVATLPPMMRELQVRAVGGDDRQMPWQTIRVVDIPGWKQYKFQIQPPDYIRQSPIALQRLTASSLQDSGFYELIGHRISVVSGSRVRFEGELAVPVRNIAIRSTIVANQIASASSERETARDAAVVLPWKMSLQPDQLTVRSIPEANSTAKNETGLTEINQSIAWSLQLETEDQVWLESPNAWKIEALPDNAPEVMLEPPRLKSLTLGASLQLQAVARDDWGLRSIAAKLSVAGPTETVEIELPIDLSTTGVFEQSIKQTWSFASQLQASGIELSPQDQVSYWIEAVDLGGKTSKSNIERLTLESKQHQLESIASRQASLAEQLGELISAQQSARELAQRTSQDLKQQQPAQQHLDAIRSVSQLQQSIRQQLTDSPRCLLSEVDRLLLAASENQLDETPFTEQLKQMRSKIAEIGEDSATASSKASTDLHAELARSITTGDTTKIQDRFSALDAHQTQTESRLRELADQLGQSDSANQLREKLIELTQKHGQLASDTNQLNVEAVQKLPQDFAQRLAVAVSAQADVATKVEQWIADVLQRTKTEGSTVDPRLGEQLHSAARLLVESQVIAAMRTSASNLKSQQLGAAIQAQKQSQNSLEEAIKLFNASELSGLMDDLATQEQRLRELSDRAQKLAGQQSQLAGELTNAEASASNEMAGKQNRLGQETEQLSDQANSDNGIRELIDQARELQRLAADAASKQQMSQAAELAAQAAKKLEEAAAQLNQKSELANQQVVQQQMYELARAIEQLVMNQKSIMALYEHMGQLSEDLNADFVTQSRSLVQKQSAIRESLRELLISAKQLEVFHWVLQQAENDLTRAIAAAERNRFKPDAINAADAGLRKLILANQSLVGNPTAPGNPQGDEQNPDENAQQNQPSEISMPPLASLKLIRSLQLEIKEQTAAIPQDTNRRSRIAELTKQQQELGDLLEKLIAESEPQGDR
jgi:hypothetical protein